MKKSTWKRKDFEKPSSLLRVACVLVLSGVASLVSMERSFAAPPSAAASIMTTVDGAGDVGEYSSLELNEYGFAVISYYDGSNSNLKLAVCNNIACTSPDLIVVDSSKPVGKFSSLKLNSNDLAFISYQDGGSFSVKYAACDTVNCNSPTLTPGIDSDARDSSLTLNHNGNAVISTHGFGDLTTRIIVCGDLACSLANRTRSVLDHSTSYYTSVVINDNNFPVVSYYDGENGNLKLATCGNVSCTFSDIVTVDSSTNDTGLYSSMMLNDSGDPVISYKHLTYKTLELAICKDAACTVKTSKRVDSINPIGSTTSLALDSNGFPTISYMDDRDRYLRIAVCNDTDCTNPTLTAIDNGDIFGRTASLEINQNHKPVVSYYNQTKSNLEMVVCNMCIRPTLTTVDSGNGGITGLASSMALNSSGNAVISYYDASFKRLKLAICNDATCSNPNISTVNSTFVMNYISLALNDEDIPIISYYNVDDHQLEIAICNDANCSNPTLKSLTIGNSLEGKYTSVAYNNLGFPAVSYLHETNAWLMLAYCWDATCDEFELLTVATDPGRVGEHTSMVMNSSNFPVISHYDDFNKNLILSVCANALCFGTVETRIIDGEPGNVGEHSSIALNSNGYPVISYFESDFQYLKLAVCNDALCTQPTLTTVDSSSVVGRYTSLSLTKDDYPIISYVDLANDNFKVAVCNNITCTKLSLTTFDTKIVAGRTSTSMALNSGGFPVISYFDETNKGLKLAIFQDTRVGPVFKNGFE